MKRMLLLCLGFSEFLMASAPVPYQWGVYKKSATSKSEKPILVSWFTPEGRKRLTRSKFNDDFYQLAHAYQPQINPIFAGIASMVVVLNAFRQPKHTIPSQEGLEVPTPKSLGGQVLPFPAYSQWTFLNEKTDKVKDRKVIELKNVTPENENDKSQFRAGTSMEDLKGILDVYAADATIVYADKAPKVGAPAFREMAKSVLRDATRFILVNFDGQVLGAATGGTVSPIAAYDAASDSVLVLDVTEHKNPWYWVPLESLYQAMNTHYDNGYMGWRGYVVVSDR